MVDKNSSPDPTSLARLKEVSSDVAKKAGKFIKSQFSAFDARRVEVKDYNSLVSYVDIEAEKMIVDGLQSLIPNASFRTEEGTVEQNQEDEYVWVIDPLDGTTNFIHQLPFFSVSIALKWGGSYILGVIYDVMHDDLYAAAKGQGATVNDQELLVSGEQKLENVLLATGFPYNSFEQMEDYLALFRVLFQSTRGLRRVGSAALDLCYVAKGTFAGFFEYGLNEWDIAAGICIVGEAGGNVTDFHGKTSMVEGKTILATNTHVHDELLSLIRENFNLG